MAPFCNRSLSHFATVELMIRYTGTLVLKKSFASVLINELSLLKYIQTDRRKTWLFRTRLYMNSFFVFVCYNFPKIGYLLTGYTVYCIGFSFTATQEQPFYLPRKAPKDKYGRCGEGEFLVSVNDLIYRAVKTNNNFIF